MRGFQPKLIVIARTYQLILIPLLFVIAAVVGTLAYSRWVANHTVPGPGSLEGRLQGVGDWAKGEQGLELLGAYTFVTTEEIDTARNLSGLFWQMYRG